MATAGWSFMMTYAILFLLSKLGLKFHYKNTVKAVDHYGDEVEMGEDAYGYLSDTPMTNKPPSLILSLEPPKIIISNQ